MKAQLGLWVIVGMLLCGNALAGGAAEGGIVDATDGVDVTFGYSVDAGPECQRHRNAESGAAAHVEAEGLAREAETGAPSFNACWSRGSPLVQLLALNHGVGADGGSRKRLEAGAQIEPQATEESQGQVEFADPFLGAEGAAEASRAGASGRVILLNQRVADVTLALSAAQQEAASRPATISGRWSVNEGAGPAWDAEDEDADVAWTQRAARGMESALRPYLPAGMTIAPVPTSVGGAGEGGVLEDLKDAQLVGLAAAGLIPAMLAALYQRFTASASMQHERRAAIHKALAAWPQGATAGEVARALDMKRKTVEYHLNYCAKAGLVRVGVGPDGARRYSLGALPPRLGVSERLLSIIRERPGLSTAELAAVLGVPRDGVDRRVKEFAIQGVVECRLVEGERRMFPGGA